jgi:asparagine synthase (glutamine-hydrolysing)
MCGIAGTFQVNAYQELLEQKLTASCDSLAKRGPDGKGIYINGSAALGHRRLSIIDTSSAANQPMHSADNRYVIVFNGEIFNYLQLKEKYLTREETAALRTHSDTEVFLQLFIKLKEKCFELLRGFFAAAIYDKERRELTVVRDRFGKKPLLYFRNGNDVWFASEMKSLFAMGIPKEIDWDVLPLYLQLNYIPQPHSLIKGVAKLMPGHFMKLSCAGISIQSYAELNIQPEHYGEYTYEQAQEKLVTLMDEAVRLRLIADVPLGAFLSGGIDSSVVVALASKYEKLNTFSIGYQDNPFFDETYYANLVAKKYQTNHTVFSLKNADFLEHLFAILDYIDEPYADSSAIPMFILSYHTRKHVTVALSGDGGDEVFAGYNKHGAEWQMRAGGLKSRLVQAGYPLWNLLPKSRNNKLTNTFRQLSRYAYGARLSAAERYWHWATFLSPAAAVNLLHENVRKRLTDGYLKKMAGTFTETIKGTDFNEVLQADMKLVLLGDMLPKVDLMSMANSLEVRSPFLDSAVVDFAFSLPAAYKIDGHLKKKIVQEAFRPMLPEELYNRPKKGFEIPLLGWFRNELWPLIDNDLLNNDFIVQQGIFDSEAIRTLKRRLRSSDPGDSHSTIWALIVFQYWWKKYFS